jgi:hypothetical protein
LLIAEVGAAGNGTQPSVSDSEGAWTLMVYNQEAATTRSVSIWAKIASGSQPTAITASRTGATAMWINLSEWSGASSSLTGAVNSVDGSNGLSVTGAAITTTDAGSMVVAACLSSGPMTAPGESGPFTVSQTNPATPNTRLIDAYHIPGSIGTYTPTFTWTTTNRTSSVATAEFFPAASSTPKSDTDTGVGTEDFDLVKPGYPALRGVGAVADGAGVISPGLPADTAVGDLLMMFLETTRTDTITVSGWTELFAQPTGTDATENKLQVFYRIATGTDPTATSDPADHAVARILGIKAGTFDPITPFDITAYNIDNFADTTGAIIGATTTVPKCVVLVVNTTGFDPGSSSAAEFSAWTNTDLDAFTERIDNITAIGSGGGIGVASGMYVGPGTFGNTSVVLVGASYKVGLTIVIAPIPTFISGTDSGSGAEASIISLVSPDTGTGSETPRISLSSPDTGAGAEASAIAISLSDTGAGSDTSAIRITASDAGSGADASSVSSPVSVSDSGTGSDTSVIAYALSGSDSGTGADASVISAALSSTDTGAGADTGTSGNPVSGADTGVGTDASVISAVLSSSDSGAGADTSRIFLVASDSGAGSEASAVGLSFIVTDSGTGVDASIGRASFIVSDSGAGSDSGGTPITGTDSGVGSDNLPRKAAGGLALLFGDSGVWGFISPVTVRLSPVDVGVGTDVTFLKVVHSDAGAAVEITGLARTLSEAITSVESSTLVAAVSATENGVGTDTAILTVAASVSDSGSGTDSLALSRIVNDAASGTEAQSISLSLSDAGSFVDQLSVFTRTVSDSIFSLEGSLVTLDAPGFFISNDGGSTTENATVIAVNSVTDAGTGSDASSLASVLFAQDSGLGIENQSYKAVNLDSDFGFSEDDSTLTARFVLADSGTDTENFSKGMLVADVGSISETVNMGLVASEFGLAEDETGLFREVFDFGAGFADENISQLVEDLGYEDDLGFILYNIGGPGTGRRPNIVKTKDRAKLASAN